MSCAIRPARPAAILLKRQMNNLANILTIARLLLLLVIVGLFYIDQGWAAWTCLGLYVVAAITDFLDGWVARKFNQITPFGTFMDPIADKVFVAVILMMLIASGRLDGLWVIAALIIMTREFLVSGMREFLGPKNIKLPVSQLAKWKTALQMIALGILIIGPFVPLATLAGNLSLSGAAVLTVITGWAYLKTGFAHMKA